MFEERFIQFNKELTNLFMKHGKREVYRAHQIIFIKNEQANNLYYIEKGNIRVYIPYRDGSERTLCYFHPGTIIGEEAFATPPIRIVCTNSMTESRLYRLSAKEILAFAKQNPKIMENLLSFFMKKITLLHSWIFYGQFKKNEDKLACLIYTLSCQQNKISLSHEQMAAVTGMSRVTATRILDSFVKKGLISQQYKTLKVLNVEALRDIFDHKEFY